MPGAFGWKQTELQPMISDEGYSCSDDAMDADDHDDGPELIPSSGSYDYQRQILFYSNFDSVTGRSLQRPKTRRRRWTQRDMTNAYNAVKYQGMSLRGAATAFNVPESTLRDRVHGRVSLECSRPGPPTFFTYEEEKKMVDHILFMSKIGYPYTRNQVVELAGDMTKAVGRIAPFKYLNPSQAWFYAFLNRWPDLKNFLFGPRSNRKSKGVSGDSIQAYFEQLEKVITKYGIKDKAEHFWIVDEVSISCENQPPRILPISIQRAQSVSYWNPTVAMLGAANGIGEKIPPFLIYRGNSVTPSMMEGSVRGTKFSYSASGWVNSDAFIQWFLKHFRLLVTLRPLVLFYDGHLQFVSVRVLERAREDDVFLFPLPPHPAYNHCVENTCFWAFNIYFKKRLDRFFEQNPNQPLLRTNASPVLTHAYEKALQPSNMIQLFERLGICPFNNLSNAIGAYMNMTEEYDQTNTVGENSDALLAYDGYSGHNHWTKLQQMGVYNNFMPSSLTNGETKLVPGLSAQSSSQVIQTAGSSATVSGNVTRPITIRLRVPTLRTGQVLICTPGEPNMVAKIQSTKATSVVANDSNIPVPKPEVSACGPAMSSTSEQSLSDTVNHPDVDVAREEEVGFEGHQILDVPATPRTLSGDQYGFATDHGWSDTGAAVECMDEIEDGEAPDFCVVCGQLEPPESACRPMSDGENADDLQVVDWVHCDYCNRWVHWNGSCSKDAIIGNNSFMCVVCRQDGTIGELGGYPVAKSSATSTAESSKSASS
ncbi:39S ribosomal protein L22 mitochondrial [Fasciolopsis buskii]|uniref:39S ribosomal protein L22 mitochondrial n=1 Tax=Fasciolopsis buskii TaxID=27845 RepID=A0A8E0VMG5_9TREM|nr:39S ribosomal protein L22 mitochondrial [Fasciolopsis buski]